MVWILPQNFFSSRTQPKQVYENCENLNKKTPRGIALRSICTKFDPDWKVFRHGNDDTFSVTHTERSQNHTITE